MGPGGLLLPGERDRGQDPLLPRGLGQALPRRDACRPRLPVAEPFHPLWGGDVDVPSFVAFQETLLQTFWPGVVFFIAIAEVFSVFTFQNPAGSQPWAISLDHEPGDLGFDPRTRRHTLCQPASCMRACVLF